MAAYRIFDEARLGALDEVVGSAGYVRPADGGRTPGAWAARLRLTLTEPVAADARFDFEHGFELFVDGDSIARSSLATEDQDAAHEFVRLDLAPGRHELFALLWSVRADGPSPYFRFTGDRPDSRLETGSAPWQTAPLKNVAFPIAGRSRCAVLGEPTGPNGMDRGAEWSLATPIDLPSSASFWGPTKVEPLPPDSIEEPAVVEGEGSPEAFRDVLADGGAFSVAAGERVLLRFRLPEGPVLPSLRASGGAGSTVRIGFGDDPANVDLFAPRGFRQDFASFGAFEGGEGTLAIEGGERGTALFRLTFLRELSG